MVDETEYLYYRNLNICLDMSPSLITFILNRSDDSDPFPYEA